MLLVARRGGRSRRLAPAELTYRAQPNSGQIAAGASSSKRPCCSKESTVEDGSLGSPLNRIFLSPSS
jgi:hypothetical protein